MILTSGFNFPFFTSTLFSMCFGVDVGTTYSKRVLSFFTLFNLMNGTNFSKTRKSMNMPISTSKKEHLFQE